MATWPGLCCSRSTSSLAAAVPKRAAATVPRTTLRQARFEGSRIVSRSLPFRTAASTSRPFRGRFPTSRGLALCRYLLCENSAEVVSPGVADVAGYPSDLLVAEDVPPRRHAVVDEPVENHRHDVVLVGQRTVAGEARTHATLARGAVAGRAVRVEGEVPRLHHGLHLLLWEGGDLGCHLLVDGLARGRHQEELVAKALPARVAGLGVAPEGIERVAGVGDLQRAVGALYGAHERCVEALAHGRFGADLAGQGRPVVGASVDAAAGAGFIQDVQVDAATLVVHEVLTPAGVRGEVQGGAACLSQDVAGDGYHG